MIKSSDFVRLDKLRSQHFILLVGIFIAIVLGIAAGVGSKFGLILGLGFIVVLFGSALLFNPEKLFLLIVLSCLCLVGCLESFLFFPQANWIGVILVLLLVPGSVIFLLRKPVTMQMKEVSYGPTRMFDILVAVYFLYLFFSAFVNFSPLSQFIVALKAYAPFLLVYFVLAIGVISYKTYMHALMMVLLIACAQGLVNVVIAAFVAPHLTGGMAAYESIVGTFGGNLKGGAYSGELVIFLCVSVLSCLILYRGGHIRLSYVILSFLSLCTTVAIAESKVFFVVFPLSLLLYAAFCYRICHSIDLHKVMYLLIPFSCIVFVYFLRFWSQEAGGAEHAFLYSFDPDFMISPGHRGRVGSIIHWFTHVPLELDFIHTLVGYGPGASIGGAEGNGSVVAGIGIAIKLFGPGLDNSAVTKALWDLGVIGFFIQGLLFLKAYTLTSRFVFTRDFNSHLMLIFRISLIILFLTLPYQPGILGGIAFQFLFWFVLGSIRYICAIQIADDMGCTANTVDYVNHALQQGVRRDM